MAKPFVKELPPVNPTLNEQQLKRMEEMVGNAMLMRGELFKKLFDPRRDIDDECGYPKSITRTQYRLLWDREAIAKRVVEVLPKESWQVSPEVYENEDTETSQKTPFDESWAALGQNLRGPSWYKQEDGNPVWEFLLRADILSGIGSYGIILLGIDDGKGLNEPIDGIGPNGLRESESINPRKLLFLRVFDQSLVQITRFQSDPANRRYGLPEMYQVTFNDLLNQDDVSGIGLTTNTVDVHWSRVIHISDNMASSEVFGVPRMQPVYNRLYDLVKLYSGSAEMYWRGAFPGLSIESHPQLGGDVEINKEGMRDMMTSYSNGLQRYLTLVGMTAKSLAPQVVDPSPQIKTQLEAICILLGCPMRVFLGSERGELASSQDDDAWNDRLKNRQATHISPHIVIPFIDRLILIGCLAEPGEEGYKIKWPDLSSLSNTQRAAIAVQRTQALGQYASMGISSLMTERDFLVRILNLEEEEADAIIEAALEQQDENNTGDSPLLSMVGGITGMTQLFTLMGQGVISEETLAQLIMVFYGLDEDQAWAIIAQGPPVDPTEPPPGTPPEVPPGDAVGDVTEEDGTNPA